ncbi:MAG TPA: hypothetical protein VGK74_07535 [Symbiobacteriaceae bacterium]
MDRTHAATEPVVVHDSGQGVMAFGVASARQVPETAPQHYRATEQFSASDAAQQRERDYMKLGICVTRGITLVIIQPENLTLQDMRQRVENLLPLRDVTGHDLLLDYLELESDYRRFVSKL